jgi:hypothetical protein
MATYGLQTVPGSVPFTGWTNVLGGSGPGPSVPAASGSVMFNGITQGDDRIAKMIRQGEAGTIIKALWLALTGTAAGGNATATQKRIAGYNGDFYNSLRPIEVVTYVNRATTAADVTALAALLNRNVFPTTYAADLSGNGGGGKQSNGAY